MSQFLIFKSDGAALGVEVSKVSGTTTMREAEELISSSKCLFHAEEEEKYIIWRGNTGLKVKEVRDVFEIEEIQKIPVIFSKLPFLGISVFEKGIVYLLDFDGTIEYCLKKGEENGK